MKALIIGGGAVGGLLGAHLARAGWGVAIVGRPPLVEAVRADGLRLESPGGEAPQVFQARAAASLEELAGSDDPPYDILLSCVKAYDVKAVIQDLRRWDARLSAARDGQPVAPVACFQNGVEVETWMSGAVDEARVVAATLTCPASMPRPGVARLERRGGGIGLAPYGLRHARPVMPAAAEALLLAFADAGLEAAAYDDWRAMKWSKMFLNIMGNASGAILDWTARQVYADRCAFRVEAAMLREALAVMRAMHTPLVNLPGYPAAALGGLARWTPASVLQPLLLRLVARGRGDKRPSFHYDVPRGGQPGRGRCEVEYLNGAIARQSLVLGVPAPVNGRLTRILMSLVGGVEPPDAWRGQPEKLADVCLG